MKQISKKIIAFIIQFEAKLVLNKYKPKVIAVTGNVGKTSAKDAIFSVMSSSYFTRKSEKSFNSDIGIPLTILGCQNAWLNPIIWLKNIIKGLNLILFKNSYPEWLILEVGADRPGDIRNITKWLKPDVVVVTTFAKVPVHVEFFKNREELIREKRYLVEALKHDGVLIVNGDDEDAMKMKESSNNISIIYGTDESCDLFASDLQIYYDENKKPAGVTFKVSYKGNVVPIIIKGTLGKQNIYSALSAIAVGLSHEINIVESAHALLNHETPKGRMRIIPGIKNTIIIDDTYNSSPAALTLALETLKSIKNIKRRIAVLGDMLELGKHSADKHYDAGKLAAKSCHLLITVGIRARKIAEGALDMEMNESNIFQFDDSREAGKFLQNLLKEKDYALIKGSQSMRMERVVEEVMADPEKANELLVRQDKQWKMK